MYVDIIVTEERLYEAGGCIIYFYDVMMASCQLVSKIAQTRWHIGSWVKFDSNVKFAGCKNLMLEWKHS